MNPLVRAQDTQKVTDSLLGNWIILRGSTALKAVCQIYQISAGNLLSYFAINLSCGQIFWVEAWLPRTLT